MLPAGVWTAAVTGTYSYDDDAHGAGYDSQRADAECSTASPFGDGIVDTVAEPGDGMIPVAPSPIGEWQPYRYLVISEPASLAGAYPNDPLDLLVNGLPTAWVAPKPTFATDAPGAVANCDTLTHRYETAIMSDGSTPTTFQIYDLYYLDNAGALNVVLTRNDG